MTMRRKGGEEPRCTWVHRNTWVTRSNHKLLPVHQSLVCCHLSCFAKQWVTLYDYVVEIPVFWLPLTRSKQTNPQISQVSILWLMWTKAWNLSVAFIHISSLPWTPKSRSSFPHFRGKWHWGVSHVRRSAARTGKGISSVHLPSLPRWKHPSSKSFHPLALYNFTSQNPGRLGSLSTYLLKYRRFLEVQVCCTLTLFSKVCKPHEVMLSYGMSFRKQGCLYYLLESNLDQFLGMFSMHCPAAMNLLLLSGRFPVIMTITVRHYREQERKITWNVVDLRTRTRTWS